MAGVARTKAALRIVADGLDPEVVTQTLGCAPSWQVKRGEPNPRAPRARASTGVWSLQSTIASDEQLEAHLLALLEQLPRPSAIRDLPDDWDAEFFVGLFMRDVNEGFSLSPDLLRQIGDAGLGLGFDIYGPLDDLSPEPGE